MSIYCHMEKIIYIYADTKQAAKAEKSIGERLSAVLCLPYPVTKAQAELLGYTLEGWQIGGLSGREAARLWQGLWEENKTEHTRIEAGTACRRERSRLFKTLKKIEKRMKIEEIKQREMRAKTDGRSAAFLFLGWEVPEYPYALLKRFYEKYRAQDERAKAAEQLILIDGGNGTDTFHVALEEADKEMTLVSEICGTYNYVTIITERAEAWDELKEHAYMEYGLSIRCGRDGKELHFLEKRTLIVDFGQESPKCCKNYPKQSIYMDFVGTEEKKRVISVKCREIPYLSVRNALDTALKDKV